MVSLVDKDVVDGKTGTANLVTWRSGTIDRVCAGSLAAEANAMAAACHQCEWVQQAFCEMTNACYDYYARQATLQDWESSCAKKPFKLVIRGALVAREDVDQRLMSNIAITDAKALYDALDRDCLKAKEKQVALVTAEIKQVMSVVGLVPRWMPHNEMAVDGLTKGLKKSNIKPLLRYMQTGQLRLTAESDEMEARRETRAAGGKIGRDKGGRRGFQEDA
jgi:hypothetical protein